MKNLLSKEDPDKIKEIGILINLHHEATIDKLIRPSPLAQRIILPLRERAESLPQRAIVQPGRSVKRGEQISSPLDDSPPIFSPVWGDVVALETRVLPWIVEPVESVIIIPKKDELLMPNLPLIRPPASEEIKKILERTGVLNISALKAKFTNIDPLIINCCQMEPYITNSQRLLEERYKEIIQGGELLLEVLTAERMILTVATEKEDLLEDIRDFIFTRSKVSLEVFPLRYPLDEEALIQRALRVNPEESLILDLAYAFNAYKAVYLGEPPLEVVLTLSGPALRNPQNIEARIGTPLEELIAQCDGFIQPPEMVVMNGPMRGSIVNNLDFPVTRYHKGFVFFPEGPKFRQGTCLSCGSCIEACPMGLYPIFISETLKGRVPGALEEMEANKCILCGLCTYLCPARIPHNKYLRRLQEKGAYLE